MNIVQPSTSPVKPARAEVATWLQSRGYSVDATTGKATRVEFVVAPERLTPRQRYDAGFAAYSNGKMFADVEHDEHMLRGFRAALNAQAACTTGYDKAMGW